MVKVEVGKKDIGDVAEVEYGFMQRYFKSVIAVQVITTEKLVTLLVAHAGIHQDQPVHVFDEQETGGSAAHIIRIRWIVFFPRSDEHTSELQSQMRPSYAVFCLRTKTDSLTKHTL